MICLRSMHIEGKLYFSTGLKIFFLKKFCSFQKLSFFYSPVLHVLRASDVHVKPIDTLSNTHACNNYNVVRQLHVHFDVDMLRFSRCSGFIVNR